MNVAIANPSKCEVRSVIRFLNAKKLPSCEIHRQVLEVYGDVMDESTVRRWCRMFKAGRKNVHEDKRIGRPTVITDDLVSSVDAFIKQDRRCTLDEIHRRFSDFSRSVINVIVTTRLNYRKICARWVPHMLSDKHKTIRMGAALSFLDRYSKEGDEFLSHIVTGDETWVSYSTPECKRQSMEWHHSHSPSKPRKFKRTLSTRKILATVFWDKFGPLLIEFLPQGTTINADRYCETLKQLRRAIQNRRRGLLSVGVVFLHDNARPHVARKTKELLERFQWEVIDHPPYSPDLAPSDFHLFAKLKMFLAGRHFATDEELKDAVTKFLYELAADEYDEGIQKLVPRYDKCLNIGGDYVEK